MNGSSPLFIAVEGIDGTGKSTIVPQVVAELERRTSLRVALKPEFPAGRLNQEFQAALLKGLFLSEHLTIPPAAAFFYLLYAETQNVSKLPDAEIIIADRYLHTHAIYQTHFVSQPPPCPKTVLYCLEQLFNALRLPIAHFVFILDGPLELSIKRLTQREGRIPTCQEQKTLLTFQENYRQLASHKPGSTIMLDATWPTGELVNLIVQQTITFYNGIREKIILLS